ncbi:MAG: YicC family protein [Acidobacteria bacterium]|nr:YicC family protein [Acidobacteriota bacterium]
MSVVSMTGFGRASGPISERFHASVVVRSVNHRYLDLQVRTGLGQEAPEIEAMVRTLVQTSIRRGHVVVQIDFQRTQAPSSTVMIDEAGIEALMRQVSSLELHETLMAPVSLGDILAVPGLVVVERERMTLTEEELASLASLAREGLEKLDEMRRTEGQGLVDQILSELGALEEFLDWFEPRMDGIRELLVEKLKQRLAELLGPGHVVDEQRLVMEAGVQADRMDVSEEVVRLRGHVKQLRDRLAAGGTVGRALDFLCQEINRELNTLGSKVRETGFSGRLVDAKGAVERIREQVQNLE